MAKSKKEKATASYVIDTHGLRDALQSKSNIIRTNVIGAIETNDMLILRFVSAELKDNYEIEYQQLQSFRSKKYLHSGMSDYDKARLLTELNGSSIFGSIPGEEFFRSLATAMNAKLTLVTSKLALKKYRDICKKCGVDPDLVVSIEEFAK